MEYKKYSNTERFDSDDTEVQHNTTHLLGGLSLGLNEDDSFAMFLPEFFSVSFR